jgi:hypothetical protein
MLSAAVLGSFEVARSWCSCENSMLPRMTSLPSVMSRQASSLQRCICMLMAGTMTCHAKKCTWHCSIQHTICNAPSQPMSSAHTCGRTGPVPRRSAISSCPFSACILQLMSVVPRPGMIGALHKSLKYQADRRDCAVHAPYLLVGLAAAIEHALQVLQPLADPHLHPSSLLFRRTGQRPDNRQNTNLAAGRSRDDSTASKDGSCIRAIARVRAAVTLP